LNRRIYHAGLAAVWLVVAAVLLLKGLHYYAVPIPDRPFADGHGVFDPAGRVGNRLGIAGAGMMAAGVMLYSTRKRLGVLQRAGRLRDWLSLHIFLCTLGPFLVVLHTSFRVGGLVAIAFWSMVVVVVSGIAGRYVYVRIPHAVDGHTRTLAELEAESRELLVSVREALGPSAPALEAWLARERSAPASIAGAVVLALAEDARALRERGQLEAVLAATALSAPARAEVLAAVRRYRRLSRERARLVPFQRLFGYWHAFHLPLAIVMLLVLAVHIGVAVAFGYGWTP
jgi:hypothetical protein